MATTNDPQRASLSSESARVLVVDDDPVARQLIRAWLEPLGYTVAEIASGGDAIEAARDADVICLDLGLADADGVEVLKHLRAGDPDAAVVVVTANRDITTAVHVMRLGACDYVTKPLDPRCLAQALTRAAERRALLRRAKGAASPEVVFEGLVGKSLAMQELARQMRSVLESDITVCVRGESGTGKELVARALHAHGKRRHGPFIAVNCAAIPTALQESELFGHDRGAFTGALASHAGRFERANGGTLFLDEIGEMSPATQAAVLRTLQERTVRRVGGSAEIKIDVRVICATHRDLEAEIAAGRFREDLYFRLAGYPLHVPPLRERSTDIPLLVGALLHELRADVGRAVSRVSADAMDALTRYSWPGNVRELRNVIHRAMLTASADEIELSHLPSNVRTSALPPLPAPTGAQRDAPAHEPQIVPLRDLEREAIARALRAANGSVTKAARMLGLGRATLYRRLATPNAGEATDADGAPDNERG